MFDGRRADRLISEVLSAGSLDHALGLAAADKLKALRKLAVPKIITALRGATIEHTTLLVELLRRLIDTTTLDYCLRTLTDTDKGVVEAVVGALKSASVMDASRVLALLDDPEVSKRALLEILSAHKQRGSADTLLRCAYKFPQGDQAVLFRIVEELADEQLIPSLINRLDAQDAGLRARVAAVLSRFSTPPVQRSLRRLLADSDAVVRLTALDGLSQMGTDLGVEQLFELTQDPDTKIRNKAIEALAVLDHPDTARHLLKPLQGESEPARRAAVEVLNRIANAGVLKELLLAIKDSEWWIRSRAADALAELGGARVMETVIELVTNPDEIVRRAAIEIINATRNQRTFDYLVDSLRDADRLAMESAIDALGDLGSKRAAPTLIKMLDRSGQDEDLAVVIMRALGKLGSTAAIEPIIARLRRGPDNVRREAVAALSALCDEAHAQRVVEALNACTASREQDLKRLAALTIERILAAHPITAPSSRSGAVAAATRTTGAAAVLNTQSVAAAAVIAEIVDTDRLRPGDMLADRYRFIRPIGKGAFGAVFLMEDLMIKEEIILKFLNPRLAGDEGIIKRFVYELRFARKITHPNVIRIFDMLNFGKACAISMEYFPSHTLGSLLRAREPLAMHQALPVIRHVCTGMEAAHQAGVIHRDLKPNNILIDDQGWVKIVDFGVAAAERDTDTRLTKAGLVIGTPTYMAPEQVLAKPIDARSDIYSLGVIMYEVLTGQPPFAGGDSLSVMYQHVQGGPRAPRELNPRLPLSVSAVILKAMATDPQARFRTMGELKASLAPFTR